MKDENASSNLICYRRSRQIEESKRVSAVLLLLSEHGDDRTCRRCSRYVKLFKHDGDGPPASPPTAAGGAPNAFLGTEKGRNECREEESVEDEEVEEVNSS